MKPKPHTLPECNEGTKAYQRFDATMGALLAVPKATLDRRERAYKKRAQANPSKPGPKEKKRRVSRASS